MKKLLNIYLLLCLCLCYSGRSYAQWTQLGDDIEGKTDDDKLGHAVAYSSDGTTIAIGIPNAAGGGNHRGSVQIYQKINNLWTQIGQNIDGESDFDQSGSAVSLSSDGSKVAISAIYNSDNSARGHVRIYQYDGKTWTQLGEDIDGKADADNFGSSIALASNGLKIVVGAVNHNGEGLLRGYARVYEFKDKAWRQIGTDLNGESDEDHLGSTVTISADGSKIAVSAANNTGSGLRGRTRVYQYEGNAWVQLGADINGIADEDNSGCAIAFSADGRRIAVGASGYDGGGYNAGHLRVYQYDGKSWLQLGSDIKGKTANSQLGGALAFSADGMRVAVGARFDGGGGYRRGLVQVYTFDGRGWTSTGEDIKGENDGDLSGFSLAMSAAGDKVAIGAPFNSGNSGTQRGHVRVYQSDIPPSVKMQNELPTQPTPSVADKAISQQTPPQVANKANDENNVFPTALAESSNFSQPTTPSNLVFSEEPKSSDKVLRGVKLVPDSANHVVNIDNGGQIINNIIVSNTAGQKLITKIQGTLEPEKAKGLLDFDIKGLTKGVYLVHLISGDKVATLKLMKAED